MRALSIVFRMIFPGVLMKVKLARAALNSAGERFPQHEKDHMFKTHTPIIFIESPEASIFPDFRLIA